MGGKGTRLRPLTETAPKPMLPVLGRPCLEYVIRSLTDSGMREIILACGYRSDHITDFVGDGSDFGAHVTFAYEEEPAGTAGSVKLLEDRLDDSFVVASGDVLADVDLGDMVAADGGGAAVTMALTRVDDPTQFGIVGLNDAGWVSRFKEKPRPEEVFSNLINAGIYVLDRDVLGLVPEGTVYDFSKDLFPEVLERGMGIRGHVLDGFWMDIGRPSDLLRANIDRAAALGGPGSNYVIDPSGLHRVTMGSSVLHTGVRADDCSIQRSLVMEDAVIGRGSVVIDSIVGRGAVVGEGCRLEGAVLADGEHVQDLQEIRGA